MEKPGKIKTKSERIIKNREKIAKNRRKKKESENIGKKIKDKNWKG